MRVRLQFRALPVLGKKESAVRQYALLKFQALPVLGRKESAVRQYGLFKYAGPNLMQYKFGW